MKYKFVTSDTIQVGSRTLTRIQALVDTIPGVRIGDLGGYLERESNLSQENDLSWVSGNAQVYDNAQVYGNARVFDNAWVYGNSRVFDNAQVYGNAGVSGDAQVYGNSRVFDNAQVYGNAGVYGPCSQTPVCLSLPNYNVTITDQHIKIGCQFHTFEDWASFTEDQIIDMDSQAFQFFKDYRAALLLILKASRNWEPNV